jgi:hypothetical protein
MANLITISTPQSPFLSLSTSNNLTLTNTEWGKIIGDIEDQTDLQESLTAINNSIANSVNSINAAISLLQQAINLKQSLIDKGAANGYASLNSEGKVPQSQLDVATQVNSDWDSTSGISQILNKPSLSRVAISGSYVDLTNKPTIPEFQINSDWSAVSGLAQILNKPTIPTSTTQLTNNSGFLVNSNNLSDLSNVVVARTNLGLGTLSTQSGTFSGTSSGTNTGDETTSTIQSKLGIVSTTTSGYLTSTDWTTFNNKQNALTLTTSETSGAAVLIGSTLNIPQYQSVLTNPVTGTGTSGQITYFNSTSSTTSSSALAFTPTSQLLINNNITAASAIARGINLTTALTAGANSDVLVGLDINPTFNNRSFSSVSNFAARITGNTRHIGKQEYYTIGTNSGRLSTEIYQDTDIKNASSGALYIVPLMSGGRIYFGRSPSLVTLSFDGVSQIENMPQFSINGALTWQGVSFRINKVNEDMTYSSGAPTSGKGSHRFFTNVANSAYTAPDEVFTIANTGSVSLRVGVATAIPLIVKGAASQSANLQEWRNVSDALKASVTKDFELQTVTGSGVPTTTPIDGSMYVDTINHRFYVRSGGTWKYTTLI